MPYIFQNGIIRWSPIETNNVVTALDGTAATFSPVAVTTHAPDRESANVVRERLDGTVSVLLRGDRPRAGSFDMVFDEDAAAAHAASILARKTYFRFENLERPALDMVFARSGRLGTTVHDDVRNLWTFSVGFQEASA